MAEANASGSATATYSDGPYGEPDDPAGAIFRYTGQVLDEEIGLYYYKARYYSHALGRFLVNFIDRPDRPPGLPVPEGT